MNKAPTVPAFFRCAAYTSGRLSFPIPRVESLQTVILYPRRYRLRAVDPPLHPFHSSEKSVSFMDA